MSIPKIIEMIRNNSGGGGVFKATYSVTTYGEIQGAYQAGQGVIVEFNDGIFDLITVPDGSNALFFTKRTNPDYVNSNPSEVLKIDTGSMWSGDSISLNELDSAIFLDGSTPIDNAKGPGYYRPIRTSTSAPTATDGYAGDIWIQYSV